MRLNSDAWAGVNWMVVIYHADGVFGWIMYIYVYIFGSNRYIFIKGGRGNYAKSKGVGWLSNIRKVVLSTDFS